MPVMTRLVMQKCSPNPSAQPGISPSSETAQPCSSSIRRIWRGVMPSDLSEAKKRVSRWAATWTML